MQSLYKQIPTGSEAEQPMFANPAYKLSRKKADNNLLETELLMLTAKK